MSLTFVIIGALVLLGTLALLGTWCVLTYTHWLVMQPHREADQKPVGILGLW
jgi:hypothetical protein